MESKPETIKPSLERALQRERDAQTLANPPKRRGPKPKVGSPDRESNDDVSDSPFLIDDFHGAGLQSWADERANKIYLRS